MRISDWSSDVCSSDLALREEMEALQGALAKRDEEALVVDKERREAQQTLERTVADLRGELAKRNEAAQDEANASRAAEQEQKSSEARRDGKEWVRRSRLRGATEPA